MFARLNLRKDQHGEKNGQKGAQRPGPPGQADRPVLVTWLALGLEDPN